MSVPRVSANTGFTVTPSCFVCVMAKASAIKFIVIRKLKNTERFYCRQRSNQPEAHRKEAALSFIFKRGILIIRFHGNIWLRAT